MNNETYNRRDKLKENLDFFTDKLTVVNEIIAIVTSDDDKKVWLDKKIDVERKLNNIEIELGIK